MILPDTKAIPTPTPPGGGLQGKSLDLSSVLLLRAAQHPRRCAVSSRPCPESLVLPQVPAHAAARSPAALPWLPVAGGGGELAPFWVRGGTGGLVWPQSERRRDQLGTTGRAQGGRRNDCEESYLVKGGRVATWFRDQCVWRGVGGGVEERNSSDKMTSVDFGKSIEWSKEGLVEKGQDCEAEGRGRQAARAKHGGVSGNGYCPFFLCSPAFLFDPLWPQLLNLGQ